MSITQKQQMAVIMGGMFAAFFMLLGYITDHTSVGGAFEIAGNLGKLEAVNFSFDIEERYTIWSGLTGGFFLALSYFGTAHSLGVAHHPETHRGVSQDNPVEPLTVGGEIRNWMGSAANAVSSAVSVGGVVVAAMKAW